ncbi:MAG: N-acetyltransferase [Lachnospiraceae bacterium]|nr:N-acetyltransferase [Lachnospiraceae bacterium]
METLSVRDALSKDYDDVMRIYRYAQDFMIQTGNPNQWAHAYPEPELIREDIRMGICKVICSGSKIHGVFAFFTGEDPTYGYIEDGKWPNDEPYVTIHRIAGDGQVRGILQRAVEYCRAYASNVRIDTAEDNKIMQHAIAKCGFKRCGIIYLENGDPRIAYAKHFSDKE